jgi:plasmid stabilization system protein ParE
VEFTRRADIDLTEIWISNAEIYGVEHADKYREFLLNKLAQLGEYPEWGYHVEGFPQLRCFIMRRRPSGHGHAAYYDLRGNTIRIVRALHTAMNAVAHLSED